jgi:hypothetical protein
MTGPDARSDTWQPRTAVTINTLLPTADTKCVVYGHLSDLCHIRISVIFYLHLNDKFNNNNMQGWTTRKVMQRTVWMNNQSLYCKSRASNTILRRGYLVFGRFRFHISVKTAFTMTDYSWFSSVTPDKTEIERLPETGPYTWFRIYFDLRLIVCCYKLR